MLWLAGLRSVPLERLSSPGDQKWSQDRCCAQCWLHNGAVGTRPLIIWELFSRMVGQALPHVGVDGTRHRPLSPGRRAPDCMARASNLEALSPHTEDEARARSLWVCANTCGF